MMALGRLGLAAVCFAALIGGTHAQGVDDCTQIFVNKQSDVHENVVFKRVDPLTTETATVKAFIMFFIKKASFQLQIWKQANPSDQFTLSKSWTIPEPNADSTDVESNGYKYVFNLPTPLEVSPSDFLGIYSSGVIPLIHRHMPNESYSAQVPEKFRDQGGATFKFDMLAMPYRYQVCTCAQTNCRDKSTNNTDISSKVLDEKIPVPVEYIKGDPGERGLQGEQGAKGDRGEPGRDSPQTGAATGVEESRLLSVETMIGVMLWLGVLTLLMMVVLAVLMVICVDNRRHMREKSRLYSRSISESTQNIKDPNGDWADASWQGDHHAI